MTVTIKIQRHNKYEADGYHLDAVCDGEECGILTLEEGVVARQVGRKVLKHPVLKVDEINVFAPFQRRGVATKLYEAAADLACEDGVQLASIYRLPWAKSNEFWAKQIAKGRATVWSRDPGANRHRDQIILNSCVRDLSGVRKRRR